MSQESYYDYKGINEKGNMYFSRDNEYLYVNNDGSIYHHEKGWIVGKGEYYDYKGINEKGNMYFSGDDEYFYVNNDGSIFHSEKGWVVGKGEVGKKGDRLLTIIITIIIFVFLLLVV